MRADRVLMATLSQRQRQRQRSTVKRFPNFALRFTGVHVTGGWGVVAWGPAHGALELTGERAQPSQKIEVTQPYRPRGASTTRLMTATAGLMPWSGWFGRNVPTNQICSIVGGPVASCSSTEGS